MGHPQTRFYIREVKQRKSTHYEILHVGCEDHRISLNFLFLRSILVTLFVIRHVTCITGGVQQRRTIYPSTVAVKKARYFFLIGWILKFLIMYRKMSSWYPAGEIWKEILYWEGCKVQTLALSHRERDILDHFRVKKALF